MNKLILLAFCMMSLGFIGCMEQPNPLTLDEIVEERYMPEYPTPENIPNLARMKYPVEELIYNECLNLSQERIDNAKVHIGVLQEYTNKWDWDLEQIKHRRDYKLFNLDTNNSDYQLFLDLINMEYDSQKKQIDDYYSGMVKIISYNLSLVIGNDPSLDAKSYDSTPKEWKRRQKYLKWLNYQEKPICN